jgi:hypothetical protein
MRFGVSSLAIAQTITPGANTITQEDRSLKIFRILNDIGIKFEYAKTRAFKYIQHDDFAEAKSLCGKFIDDIRVIRTSLLLEIGLTDDDKKFVDKSLGRMKRQMEQIIDDLPFGT